MQGRLEKELQDLTSLKFQLAFKVQLHKARSSGTEEYTYSVLRHKQEAILQRSKINGALDKAIPYILELLEKWKQKRSGWAVDWVGTLCLDIA